MSHVDFARLYVQNHMAHFTAFDDQCDASAVLTLLGRIPVFLAPVQTAADDVRMARNDWAHCVFTKWDQTNFLKRFSEMEHLVKTMAPPIAGKLLRELKDWETKGIKKVIDMCIFSTTVSERHSILILTFIEYCQFFIHF